MKNISYCIIVWLLLFHFPPVTAKNIARYQIIEKEVTELNKLGNSLGISGLKGWPVLSTELEVYPSIEGVTLTFFETKKRKEGEDSIIVQIYKVAELDLNGKGLSGTLTPVTLDSCKLFNLSGNQITGTIPDFKLPDCTRFIIGNNKLTGNLPDLDLPKVELLNVQYNELSGEIRNLTRMPNLKTLYIESNKFSSIATSFSHPNLQNLEYGGYSGNKISGSLPGINCPNLKFLSLGGHNFTGEIPVYNLPKCTSFSLSENQLSGILPDFNMPALESLDVSYNNLSGEIGPFTKLSSLKRLSLRRNQFTSIHGGLNLPSLETLDADFNKLVGSLPNLNLPNLVELSLADNNLSGAVPNLIMPKLYKLNLSRNTFSGELPRLSLPSLERFNVSYNKLTGAIPDFDMPQLKYLELQYNTLTGPIANFRMPNLVLLNMKLNQIEGPLPNLNLPELTELYLEFNKLSGPLPALDLPQLEILYLQSNLFSGSIPAFKLPKVKYFDISSNRLEGAIPDLSLTEALQINLSTNLLTGNIPAINLPKLTLLHFNNNKLTGSFNNRGLPALTSIGLENNSIDSIPAFKSHSSKLNTANVRRNNLKFNHIEPNIGITNFYYENQDSVNHYIESAGIVSRLYVNVGGTANKYQWMKRTGTTWTEIAGATDKSYSTAYVKGDVYSCKITNTLAPKLTLWSRLKSAPSCITLGVLEFCNASGPWEGGNKDTIKANGQVVINDFLHFDGSIAIDTAKLMLVANGSFYLNDIPLPGGGQLGKFTVSTGDYELKLLGDSGVITQFINSKLKAYPIISGVELKLTDLRLVGGRKATGVRLDCKIKIPGITGKCDEDAPPDQSAEVVLKGLTITTSGVSMKEVKIENMSMFVKDFCLKKMIFSYDNKNDQITAGAGVQMPFGEVEGGFKLSGGYLDSIGWRIEAAKPPFVLGATTIGVKGFYGHISNITEPAIEVELGGVFSDIISDKFYLVDAGGRTIWPTLFEIKGSGKFMKPPVLKFPYQLNAEVAMSYDFPLNQFKVSFDGKIGTADEKKWLLTAKGDYKMSLKYPTPKYAGTLTGTIELQKFSDKFPYNWLNSFFTFPINGYSDASFVWGNSKLLFGNAVFKSSNRGPYSLRYVVDLSKEYGTDDFLWFETEVVVKPAELKSASRTNETIHEFTVPPDAQLTVLGIRSPGKTATSSLKSPAGKVFTGTSETDNVVYSASADGTETFWTVSSPAAGKWGLTLLNAGVNDSILFFVSLKPADFSISMSQTGNNVTVTWNPAAFNVRDTIYMMLDDDDKGFDGFAVAEGLASAGSLSFRVSDSLSSCRYYLFAQISRDFETLRSYSPTPVTIVKTILPSPGDFTAAWDPGTGKTRVTFSDNQDPFTSGYLISVDMGQDQEPLYAVVNRSSGSVQLDVTPLAERVVSITAFDRNGLQGCPSVKKSISTGIKLSGTDRNSENRIMFYPNPTTGKGIIKYTLEKSGHCEVMVIDLMGRIINQPVKTSLPKGTYEQPCDFAYLPGGIYLLVLRTQTGMVSNRVVVTR